MVTVACVKVGTKYDEGYVFKLRDGVDRNLPKKPRFVCITDQPIDGVDCIEAEPGLPGWWQKLALFKPGVLPEGALYFDLDVVITGDLTRMVEWDDFGILKDWWRPTFNSSVMRLTGNEGDVWEKFNPAFMQMVEGDQDFITGVRPSTVTFPPDWFVSYKADKCFDGPPDGAMAVVFHGLPKPHQVDGWVKDIWV